nr:hypothetical protein [Prolixibacteraceae bacterium]
MKKAALLIFFISFYLSNYAQQISELLVGTNVWYYSPSEKVWDLTKECGVKTIRIGGHAYDKKLPEKEILLDWVLKIQKLGAEPILQVSQYDTPEKAAELVRFFNIEKPNGVQAIKLWHIGNEPWLQANRPALDSMGMRVESYFKPIATAMKA